MDLLLVEGESKFWSWFTHVDVILNDGPLITFGTTAGDRYPIALPAAMAGKSVRQQSISDRSFLF